MPTMVGALAAGDALGIEPAEAHVWFASATALSPRAPELSALLGDHERERVACFRHARDRERFAIRRGVLRVLLASYLGERPERLEFDERCPRCGGPHGKPRLAAPRPLRFSVSKAGDLIAYAVGRCDVGIDVAIVDGAYPWQLVARDVCSGRENAAIARLRSASRAEAFFRTWTRKEAFAKAVGEGLTLPLAEIEVSPGVEARLQSVPDRGTWGPWVAR